MPFLHRPPFRPFFDPFSTLFQPFFDFGSATPLQRQLDVRHSWQFKGDRCDGAFEGGLWRDTAATPKKRQDSEEICCDTHWEIKGRFRKRVVLANVPSFRFSFRGNIRRNHPFGNHPFVNTKKGHWEIRGRFRKRVVLANVPSFRFSFRGNIRQNHPFGNHPFANPRDTCSATRVARQGVPAQVCNYGLLPGGVDSKYPCKAFFC